MRILCPLDVYGCADAVIERALWLTRRADTTGATDANDAAFIDLMVVAAPSVDVDATDALVVGDRHFVLDAALDGETAALLRGFALMLARNGVLGAIIVRSGEPADAIVAVCAEREPELLVMGSHARTGLKRAVFGSVAEEVVRHAKRPVLVVPAGKGLHEHPSDAQIQRDAEAAG